MSEVFENDIYKLSNEELSELEDHEEQEEEYIDPADYIYPEKLFRLKLDYSCEGIYATVPDDMQLENGDFVVIPTRYGKDYARVLGKVNHPVGIRASDIVVIERKATTTDIARMKDLIEKEKQAFVIFQEKVAAHKLDMKLISTHYLPEEQKALFFFSADKRVDFRDLVKDLVSVFKMRIELRQIGVRDESRITGGLGICGRPYCCNAVSDKLKPVSIRMAKDQNLSLNSMKISGLCGRLLCCLAYEYDWYMEARKKLPSEGIRIYYDGTNFKIIEVNPLTAMIKMSGEDGRILEVAAARFVNNDGRWKIN